MVFLSRFYFRFLLLCECVVFSVIDWVQIQIHFVQFLIIISAGASLVILKNLMRVMFCLLNQSYSIRLAMSLSRTAILIIIIFVTLMVVRCSAVYCSDSAANFSAAVGNFCVLKIYLLELIIICFCFSLFFSNVCSQYFALNKSQHQLVTRTRFIPIY